MEESQKSPKRLRTTSVSSDGLTDRMGDLPHCIVQHILSFLPIKDAIKFCTISRQWDSLWKSIPNLLFYCDYHPFNPFYYDNNRLCYRKPYKTIYPFASFVDQTLTLYTCSKINKFLIQCCHGHLSPQKLESWIDFAKSRGVEQLCVNYGGAKNNEVLFANGSVWKMGVTSLGFLYHRGIQRTALKVLSLVGIKMAGDTIRSVLQESPLMEFLAIRKCKFAPLSYNSVIDVSCASLKELVIDSCDTFPRKTIEITCPNLLSLTIVGRMEIKTLKLVDVSSLVEATIDFSFDCGARNLLSCYFLGNKSSDERNLARHKKTQKSLLHKLRHVNKFTVGTRFLQVVSIRRVEGAFFGKSRRKILKITMELNKTYLPGIAALLNTSPDLEELTIKIIPKIDSKFQLPILLEHNHFAKENYWRSEIGTATSLFQNLKIVNIVGFIPESALYLGKLIVELAEFLLANAKILQKLIIHEEATNGRDKSLSSRPKLLEISQKLPCCPRASPNALVIVKN